MLNGVISSCNGQKRPRRAYLLRGQPSVRRSLPGFKHTLTTASAGGYPPNLSNVPLLVNSPWIDPSESRRFFLLAVPSLVSLTLEERNRGTADIPSAHDPDSSDHALCL